MSGALLETRSRPSQDEGTWRLKGVRNLSRCPRGEIATHRAVTVWLLPPLAVFLLCTAAYADCENAQTEVEQVKCRARQLQEAQGRLDRVYRTLLLVLPGPRIFKLRNEQQAWVNERDATCGLDSNLARSPGWLQAVSQDGQKTECVIRATTERAERLESAHRVRSMRTAKAGPPRWDTPGETGDDDSSYRSAAAATEVRCSRVLGSRTHWW